MSYKKWLVKYRPTTLEGYVFTSKELEQTVTQIIEKRTPKHLLFSGHHGTGKTALAYVIKNELGIEDFDFLKINSSDQNSVSVFRTVVRTFAESAPMGDIKICFLDEADGLTEEAQKLLRGFIDEFENSVMFIMTCNYPHKISEPLRESRLRQFTFNTLDRDLATQHLEKILVSENVQYDQKSVKKIIDRYYPDMRAVIDWAEEWSSTGTLVIKEKGHNLEDFKTLFHKNIHQTSNWVVMRDILVGEISTHDGWEDFFRFMYETCIPTHPSMTEDEKKLAYVVTAEHLFKMNFMKALPELSAVSYLLELGGVKK